MTVRLPWLLFGLLLAMCAVVGAAFVVGSGPPVPAADGSVYPRAGFEHPRFPSMDAGGPGALRHGPLLGIAWAFAMLLAAFLAACMALGIRRRGRVGPVGWRLAACGLGLAGVLTVIIATYAAGLSAPPPGPGEEPGLVLGLPAPTAWYLYVLWPFQFAFVVVFVLWFRAAVLDDETLTRFRALVEARRAGREPPAAAGPEPPARAGRRPPADG